MHHRKRYSLSILFIPLVTAVMIAGTGCGSDEADPPDYGTPPPVDNNPPSDDPKTYFTNDVYPSLATTCARCHAQGGQGPAFLATSADTAYLAIKGNVALYQPALDSLLLKKGEHAGPKLQTGQASVVNHWLDLELPPTATPDDPNVPAPTSKLDELLTEFANCMDFGDWQSSLMNNYARTQTLDSGACAGCHSHGLGGTYLSYNEEETFEANKLQPFILKLVAPDFDADNELVGLQTSRRLFEKEGGGQSCPDIDLDDFDICHPELDFQIADDQEQKVDEFVSATLRRVQRGGCIGN